MSAIFHSLNDENLIALLHRGGVGVMPTDTVYGLVCIASQPAAVERMYSLKNRVKNPGPIIAASIDQLVELGFKKRYLTAVKQFWPNAVSIEQPTSNPKLTYLNLGTGRQAVRVVKGSKLVELLKQTGPLLTSSANKPGEKTAGTIEEAALYFGKSVDFYVDGGNLSKKKPSTLIRIVDDTVEVLREGAVIIKS